MMKFYRLAIAALVAVTLSACGGGKGEPSDPENGKTTLSFGALSPSAALEEGVEGHDKTFTIGCSGTLSAKMATGTWATIKNVQKVAGGNTWTVTVTLAFNGTDETREDKLIVSCEDKSSEATIRQKPLSSLLGSTTEVNIEGMAAGKISLNLPVAWEISLTDTKAVEEWLSVTPTSGAANTTVEVSFTPKSLNLNADDRKAFGKIDLTGGTLYLDITQASYLPSGDFIADESPFGFYGAYSDGSGIVYDEYAHQLNKLTSASLRCFRIVDPVNTKFLEFTGLPETWTVGNSVSFTINNEWDKSLGGSISVKAYVGKVSSGKVWLVDENKKGYIVAE